MAVTYADLYADARRPCTEDTFTIRPYPWAYMYGRADRISRNGASTMIISILWNILRIQFLNGADPLNPGVVDQDVHLELDAAKGCRVAEVQLPRLSAGFSGHRPRPGQIKISDLHRDAQSCEPARDRGTDSARPAGDQRGAALQP